jgi:hypothetical protein
MSDITADPIAQAAKERTLGAKPKKETKQTQEPKPPAKVTNQQKPRKRVTAYVPIPLAKWLTLEKFETGNEISEIVTEALQEYRERHQ